MVDCISFNHMKNSIQLKINCCCRKVCQNVLKTESLPHQSNVPSKLAGKKKRGRKLRQEKPQPSEACQETEEASQRLRVQSHRRPRMSCSCSSDQHQKSRSGGPESPPDRKVTPAFAKVERNKIQAAGIPPRCFHSQ